MSCWPNGCLPEYLLILIAEPGTAHVSESLYNNFLFHGSESIYKIHCPIDLPGLVSRYETPSFAGLDRISIDAFRKPIFSILMGFLRFYLALCVVNAHTGNLFPWPVPRGRHAVELFFIISGFYMAMVLSGRYARVLDFYKSRWLRIAVPYYVHLVAIVLLSVASGLIFSNWLSVSGFAGDPLARNGLWGILLVSISNITIFGQDLALFFKDNAGSGLQFTSNFGAHPDPLYHYLIIPQCWTVSLELVFYLMVPFLNRLKTWHLVLLFGLAAVARLVAYRFGGLDHDPWIYRFFPFELAWFVAGMLGWRLLTFIETKTGRNYTPGILGYTFLCVLVIIIGVGFRWCYHALGAQIGESYSGFFLIVACIPLIPLVFYCTRSNRFDRLVGELSYPIYLNHLFFIVALRAIPSLEPFAPWFGLFTGILSLVCAWVFWQFFLSRFEVRRHRTFGLAPLPT
jgi:peptidoglycan/LPS O-acetylase OafA/YrhL